LQKEQIQAAIDVLNEALEADPEAITNLLNIRIPCNKALADHPTIQSGLELSDGSFRISPLGLINGLFGIDERGWGFIGAECEVDENFQTIKIYRFVFIPDSDSDLVYPQ